jgi:hypothetical protein
MMQIDSRELVAYVGRTIDLLEGLRTRDESMSYADFARHIGLWESGSFPRFEVIKILNATAAVDRYAAKRILQDDDFERLHSASGETGNGHYGHLSRIVSEKT